MKKSEVKLKSADEVNYLASSYICGADVLILCCFYCRVALAEVSAPQGFFERAWKVSVLP